MFKQKLKTALVSLVVMGSLSLGVATPAYANTFQGDACAGLTQVDSTQGCGTTAGNNALVNLTKVIITLLSFIVGTIAVIMVVIGGLRYITSGGDSSKVSAAKSALLYALIGLVIVALAQFLVHFTIGQATSGTCKSNGTIAANDTQCK